jgi:3-phenylpropionate/trans-cinnamate dioxygenase ferredoxin component
MGERVRVCSLADLPDGTSKRVVHGRHKVCLVRFGDRFYAVGDTCTHADVSLSEGELDREEEMVECWKHGSRFSLVTGQPDTLPATKPVPVYDVAVDGDDVMVTLP